MTFIVTFIALLIERFFDWSHLRGWQWYTAYQNMMMQRFSNASPYLMLSVVVVPLLIVTGCIAYAISGWFYGFAKLLFALFILLYCLGPKNLWADMFSYMHAVPTSPPVAPVHDGYAASLQRHLLNDMFVEANRRIFSVIFWYMLLGPVGAILYRSVTLSATAVSQEASNIAFLQSARLVEAVLNWVPVRLFTFIFALGGHFVQVLSAWRRHVLSGLSSNEALLTECGIAALSDGQGNMPEERVAAKAAMGLLDRSFVITLVLIAIVAWVR